MHFPLIGVCVPLQPLLPGDAYRNFYLWRDGREVHVNVHIESHLASLPFFNGFAAFIYYCRRSFGQLTSEKMVKSILGLINFPSSWWKFSNNPRRSLFGWSRWLYYCYCCYSCRHTACSDPYHHNASTAWLTRACQLGSERAQSSDNVTSLIAFRHEFSPLKGT